MQRAVQLSQPGEDVLIALKRLDPNQPDQWNPLITSVSPAAAPSDRSKPLGQVVFAQRSTVIEGRLRLDSTVQTGIVMVCVTGQPGNLQHMPLLRVRVDSEGAFVLCGVPTGTIRLLCSASGPDRSSRREEGVMTVEAGNRYRVEFTEGGLRLLGHEPMP